MSKNLQINLLNVFPLKFLNYNIKFNSKYKSIKFCPKQTLVSHFIHLSNFIKILLNSLSFICIFRIIISS